MLRVTQSDLPAVVWLSISRHPRMSLETSSSSAMAIGRGGKFNRISLVILSSSMCALIKPFIAISRSNNGLSFSHTEIIKTFNQRAKKKRSSRSFLFFGASIGDLARCCHDTRMESVNVATGSYWAGGHISIDKSAIYSTLDRSIDGQLIRMATKLLKTERRDISSHCSRLSSQSRHYSRRGLEIAALATQSFGPP